MADLALDDYIRKKNYPKSSNNYRGQPKNIAVKGMPSRTNLQSNYQNTNRVRDAREALLSKRRNLDARGVINSRRSQNSNQQTSTSLPITDARQKINALRNKGSQQTQKPKDLRDVLNKKKPAVTGQSRIDGMQNVGQTLKIPAIQNKGHLFAKALAQSVGVTRQPPPSANIKIQVQDAFQIPPADVSQLKNMRITRTLPPAQGGVTAVRSGGAQMQSEGMFAFGGGGGLTEQQQHRMFVPAATAGTLPPPLPPQQQQLHYQKTPAPAAAQPIAPAAAGNALAAAAAVANKRAAEMRHRIVIRNLPPSVNQTDLSELLSEIGILKGVKFLTGGIAIATFVKYDDALTAVTVYNKAKLDNCILDIKMIEASSSSS